MKEITGTVLGVDQNQTTVLVKKARVELRTMKVDNFGEVVATTETDENATYKFTVPDDFENGAVVVPEQIVEGIPRYKVSRGFSILVGNEPRYNVVVRVIEVLPQDTDADGVIEPDENFRAHPRKMRIERCSPGRD